MKNWGLLIHCLFVVSAIVTGIWVPIEILYGDGHSAWDILSEVIIAGLVFAHWGYTGAFQKNKDGIAKSFGHYVSILLDIILAIPLYSIADTLGWSNPQYYLLTSLLVLRRLSHTRDILDEIDSLHPVAFRLLPLAVYMPILVHLIACGWISLGSGSAGPDADHLMEYIKSIYWAFTTLTTVGYGDIVAKTAPQMLYAAATQVLGVGVFGFVLSNVASMLARLDAAREHHMSTLDRVESFMRSNSIPPHLRKRVRSYFKYLWQTHRGYNDNPTLQEMPIGLRADLAIAMNWEIINRVPMLKVADQDCLRDIAVHLQSQIVLPDEKVFAVGEPGDAMYFVHSGSIDIVGSDGSKIAHLGAGQYFGEMALIDKRPRRASAISLTHGELYVLGKKAFEEVLERHPHFAEQIHQTVSSRKSA